MQCYQLMKTEGFQQIKIVEMSDHCTFFACSFVFIGDTGCANDYATKANYICLFSPL